MSLISTLQPVIEMKKCWRRVKNSNPKMLISLAEFGQSNVLSINFYFFLYMFDCYEWYTSNEK